MTRSVEARAPVPLRAIPLGGFRPSSLIDFPGYVAAVLFTQGCSFRCPWCHNRELVLPERFAEPLDPDEVWNRLRARRGLLDGVVVTGGEPTRHETLPAALEAIRGLGFATKLDTNGAKPERLEQILKAGSVDYVAMDLKAGPEGYATVIGRPSAPLEAIDASLRMLRESGIAYELRLTVTRLFLDAGDLGGLKDWLKGVPRLALQVFRPGHTLVEGFGMDRPVTRHEIDALREELAPLVGMVEVRG